MQQLSPKIAIQLAIALVVLFLQRCRAVVSISDPLIKDSTKASSSGGTRPIKDSTPASVSKKRRAANALLPLQSTPGFDGDVVRLRSTACGQDLRLFRLAWPSSFSLPLRKYLSLCTSIRQQGRRKLGRVNMALVFSRDRTTRKSRVS